jgi:hypothetical protein
MTTNTQATPPRFTQSLGHWLGTAEVYDGNGRFLGNGSDSRQVQQLADGRVRIEVSFVGPFKHAGHYTIAEEAGSRLYQGPANVGYAETLSSGLIDANAYWPALGLSQCFFLMVLPDGNSQLSLALMSRGEKLLYVVVGQNNRIETEGEAVERIPYSVSRPPSLLSGTSYDLAHDPAAGRGKILLHRPGVWSGKLAALDGALRPLPATQYSEEITADLHIQLSGMAFVEGRATAVLHTNHWEAWSEAGDLVGSYSLSGGRALSGHFHFLPSHRRLWRREVVSHDGRYKAILHTWYRGGERVGVQFGVLNYES